jgi:hypothetical protein
LVATKPLSTTTNTNTMQVHHMSHDQPQGSIDLGLPESFLKETPETFVRNKLSPLATLVAMQKEGMPLPDELLELCEQSVNEICMESRMWQYRNTRS